MGMKKTMREVLFKHPDLFDLVIMLAEKDDVMASEEDEKDGRERIVISRQGKKKKKQFEFVQTSEGYLFRALPDASDTAA